jgi:3-isopropylmalate/(R)-2-methylmalate dehydratase large subunit
LTVACGDSHTSTHGAFGAIAFGVGTTQIRDILATQTLALARPKVRRIHVTGSLAKGVYAKDVILAVIRRLGVKGGIGYAYEFSGDTISRMTMEERLTVCNMAIEGGARVGYINPDQTTVEYLKGRPYVPQGQRLTRRRPGGCPWRPTKTRRSTMSFSWTGGSLEPQVAWGIHPGQAVGVTENLPAPGASSGGDRASLEEAYRFTSFTPGSPVRTLASTWRSSGRAPTADCPICAKRRGWPKGAMWPKGCGPWWCRGPKKCNGRPSPKD